MTLLDTMLTRRSIRKYTGEAIPQEKIDKILQAGLLSFSGRNTEPWEFIVVRDKEMLGQLALAKNSGSALLGAADCAIVVAGDSNKTDTGIEDCSIAMTYMHLMAAELGVGSCWVQCRLRQTATGESSQEYVAGLLDIPDNYQVEAILALGMPAATRPPKSIDDIDRNKIHMEKF